MTIFHLADKITATSANPVQVIDVTAVLGTPPVNRAINQTMQCEVNSTQATTVTAAFQWVGSFDPAQSLPPLGLGGVWNNIGTVQTITCTTPTLTPAVATVTNTVPYHRYGVIISTVSGTGAQATALMDV